MTITSLIVPVLIKVVNCLHYEINRTPTCARKVRYGIILSTLKNDRVEVRTVNTSQYKCAATRSNCWLLFSIFLNNKYQFGTDLVYWFSAYVCRPVFVYNSKFPIIHDTVNTQINNIYTHNWKKMFLNWKTLETHCSTI